MAKPIQIGLAGLGRAGWGGHTKELRGKEDQFQYVAACDPIAERREMMAEKYGCRTYETIEELIADSEVELVDITTRSVDHASHTKMALEAGKDVLVEKPMSLTYEEALELVNAAEKSEGNLYVRHNRRFDANFLHIKEIIESGLLGEVYQIDLNRHGFQRRDDWQTIKAFGGGQLLNWGPHVIDHALQLLDGPVEEIWSDLKRVAAVGDSEDHVKIILKGKNGRVVDLEISGGVALPSPTWIVYGTRGSLTGKGSELNLKYLDPTHPLTEKEADEGTPGQTFGSQEELPWIEEKVQVGPQRRYDIWDELYRSIRTGSPFPITLKEALEVMRVISKAKEKTPF